MAARRQGHCPGGQGSTLYPAISGLQFPTYPPRPSTGKTLLVWGGSTSVDCNAIQLAVAAGYEVFTTASPKNFEYVKKPGAGQVFDYKSPTAIPNIISALKGKTTAGALSIGQGAAEACMAILDQSEGDKFVAMATYPVPQTEPQWFAMLRTVLVFASWMISYKLKGFVKGIKSSLIVISKEVVSKTCVDSCPRGWQQGPLWLLRSRRWWERGLKASRMLLNIRRRACQPRRWSFLFGVCLSACLDLYNSFDILMQSPSKAVPSCCQNGRGGTVHHIEA